MRSFLPALVSAAALVALVAPISVLASDGVYEISQACAEGPGCFSGDAPGFPVEIGAPGSYVLTSELSPPSHAVHALAVYVPDVEVDLGGFAIRFPGAGTGAGRGIDAGFTTQTVVRGGVIVDAGSDGLLLGNSSHVEGVRVLRAGGTGISVGGESVVRDCWVGESGSHGIVALFGARVEDNVSISAGQSEPADGILVRDASAVRRNVVRFASRIGIHGGDGVPIPEVPTGLPAKAVVVESNVVEQNGRGIRVGAGGHVERNMVAGNAGVGISASSAGIRANSVRANADVGIICSRGVVLDNFVSENTGDGISCGGRIAGNTVQSNGGIGIDTSSALVESNHVASNVGYGITTTINTGYRANVITNNVGGGVTPYGENLGGNFCTGTGVVASSCP